MTSLTLQARAGHAGEYLSRETVEPDPAVQPEHGPGREWQKGADEIVRQYQQGLRSMRDRLNLWLRDPELLIDDNGVPPAARTIRRALDIVNRFDRAIMDRAHPPWRLVQLPLPRIVAPGNDGSISLEFERGDQAETYRIEPDGSVVILCFDRDRLIHRQTIAV